MRILLVILLLLAATPAHAVEPSEMLKNPAQEARAREISRNLRCLVCQGQDIDSSGADLAADLRRLVREKISAGDTDAQVYAFIRARYGDYVLMTPPVEDKTGLLWAAPLLALCAGLGAAVIHPQEQGALMPGFFIILGLLAGAVAALFVHPLMRAKDHRAGYALLVLLPGLSLAIYLLLGNPDLPDHPGNADIHALETKNDLLLAQKPMAAVRRNPNEIGDLVVLGDIALRMDKKKSAAVFYRRAAAVAKAQHDPRLPFIKEKIAAAR